MAPTEQEYADLLARMWQLRDAPIGTPEHDLTYALTELVQQYLDTAHVDHK